MLNSSRRLYSNTSGHKFFKYLKYTTKKLYKNILKTIFFLLYQIAHYYVTQLYNITRNSNIIFASNKKNEKEEKEEKKKQKTSSDDGRCCLKKKVIKVQRKVKEYKINRVSSKPSENCNDSNGNSIASSSNVSNEKNCDVLCNIKDIVKIMN
ncbi:transcription factor with AP2 domain(s) [Reticulomyxa filosa]|uniref:Transcription factor with AP2 domain(S) n=1 Tax=Reticulomyxa filosa TaxID=46433 RepID=X6LG38_RETFI|nr:transcription factor with AP2 domain(s) [Reticulomyxa filosa]|eukprot:ETN99694.1 transcription factor with AP2 domain(s) [Reticulomyxa filosa]